MTAITTIHSLMLRLIHLRSCLNNVSSATGYSSYINAYTFVKNYILVLLLIMSKMKSTHDIINRILNITKK